MEITGGRQNAALIINSVVAILSIIIGAVLGHWLSESSESRRERLQRDSTRLLIRIELDHNLKELQDYWERLTPSEDSSGTPTNKDYAKRLVQLVPPVWRRATWDALLPALALGLRSPEIEAATRIYSGLDSVTSIRQELADAEGEKP